MSFQTLLYDRADGVGTITLNRPERLNTIVPPMPEELEEAVHRADADEEVRVIVLRGAGRAFCAGFDFGEGFHHWDGELTTDGRWDPGKDFAVATARSRGAVPRFMSLWRSPKPVIAQVHGWCVGGGSDMALCADIVIASEDARIGTPYSRMWGCYLTGMWLYRLGLTRAKEHALSGRPLSGSEAVEAGLINAAVPFARLEEEVARRAHELASIPALAAGGDEADRQPGLREHGSRLHAAARPGARRADAQHARCALLHRARRAGGGGGRGGEEGRPVRRLQPGAPPRTARSRERDHGRSAVGWLGLTAP